MEKIGMKFSNPPFHPPFMSTENIQLTPAPSDRVISAWPKTVSYSCDILQRAIGFCNIINIINKMPMVVKNTLKVHGLDLDPV
eukprot:11445817-Ditylum_brightwellii.AAC.1